MGRVAPFAIRVNPDGTVKEFVLVKSGRSESILADPLDTTKQVTWQGSWRTLKRVWEFSVTIGNYGDVWRLINFPQLLFNTIAIAIVGTIGTVVSCVNRPCVSRTTDTMFETVMGGSPSVGAHSSPTVSR